MKNVYGIAAIVLAVTACDISKFAGKDQGENTNTSKPTPVAENRAKESPKPEASPAGPSLSSVLKKMEGKYAYEAKLFDNAELSSRLKKLLGKEYSTMRAKWNVESPIEIADGIFKASACEAHNCGSNNYYLFVDLDGDNINVIHVEDDEPTTYFEKGRIQLPSEFSEGIPTQ